MQHYVPALSQIALIALSKTTVKHSPKILWKNVREQTQKKATRETEVDDFDLLFQKISYWKKREPEGVWGGLWTFPECDPEDLKAKLTEMQLNQKQYEVLPTYRHTLATST